MNFDMIKGQAALEYLIIVTVLLLALLPLVYLANQYSLTTSVAAEATAAVDLIVSNADYAFSLSPGSKTTAKIFIPQGYTANESYISNNIVFMKFYLANNKGVTVHRNTKGALTGSLPSNWGYHQFSFTLQSDASVLIEVAAS